MEFKVGDNEYLWPLKLGNGDQASWNAKFILGLGGFFFPKWPKWRFLNFSIPGILSLFKKVIEGFNLNYTIDRLLPSQYFESKSSSSTQITGEIDSFDRVYCFKLAGRGANRFFRFILN